MKVARMAAGILDFGSYLLGCLFSYYAAYLNGVEDYGGHKMPG